MRNNATHSRRDAFTLIELLVAIAIIGVLVSILIPTFGTVTRNAANVATRARLSVLERGLESYRAEDALGGVYPPSRSDDTASGAPASLHLNNPLDSGGNDFSGISGSNLLVYGMVGADQLGTPGFRDLDGDGEWWDDQLSGPPTGGNDPLLYELNATTRDPYHPRYPSTGGSFVDEPTVKSIKTLATLAEDGVVANFPDNPNNAVLEQPLFTDKWDRPILYYRANRGARAMITNPDPGSPSIGVYDSRDNTMITGNRFINFQGVDFGPGEVDGDHMKYSRIGYTELPGPVADADNDGVHDILENNGGNYDNTFERFILNTAVIQRNEPVNRDTYLLISAGDDGVYGSDDDIVNWTRE